RFSCLVVAAGGGWCDERGHTPVEGFGGAEPVVRAERSGEFLPEDRAERGARDPPYDLADEVPETDRVVPGAVSRLPPGLLFREHVGCGHYVVEVVHRDRIGPAGHPGGV